MNLSFNISNYQHFSFDLWLTLIKSNPEFKHKRNLLFQSFFNINSSFNQITETIKYYDDLCNIINETVGKNIDTFEIYLLILSALQVDITLITIDVLQTFYNQTETLFLEYHPQFICVNMTETFDQIKSEGKTISILSNTGFIKGVTMRKFLEHSDITKYFDFQIYSDEIFVSKPSYQAFQEVYTQIGTVDLPKNQVLHIGDNPRADFAGAKNFGFSAFLIQP